ncbi:MAG: deaminase [Nostoc sp. DedQUE08]|uniref:bifunctional diaminohydroxyphosphoribosylaminopyrimidine deaminase/5-amino-6-(5-phosphoribosylamino)uracil reductase RibD n=1 Tax=unclassified Nostoc TaxID=2593658 RepID=UPI002AD31D97|nr:MULTISPECIES: deaminase [unclassified Nostoc]MDZ8032491.1 deaminase [Nostoc sp. DedSLP04]MDZ8069201.1 deaminase [Nostoc sp. DedQUE08]MDZ8093196.1 deaminase [Nostoc sp. DedQUE05]
MDEIFMLAALAQSRKALPECLPNPPVGCAIVDGQEIVAQGYTQAPGKHHAEADALKQIQGKAFNSLKMYVTLEPCSFHGRTPACALAIAKDCRIHEIYVSILDPDHRNNGKGLDILRIAGKIVNVGLCANEVNAFLSQYLLKS